MTNERSVLMTPWRTTAALAVAAAAVAGLMLTAFAGSNAAVEPRDLPVAVAGTEEVVAATAERLEAEQPGAFEVVGVADAAAAQEAVEDREVYGAVVAGPAGPERVLVASAASGLTAQLLGQLGTGLQVPVDDVVPAPVDDPRGTVLGASALPITVGGVALGTLLALVVRGRSRRLAGLLLGAPVTGLVVIGIAHGWLGAMAGDWWAEAGVVALGVLAIAAVLAGLHRTAGRAGLVAGDLVLVLVGNPFSAATSAPELLPEPWSSIGHWLPLGATVDALRGVSGFDGAGTGLPLAVLAGWTLLGLALLSLSRARPAAPVHDDTRTAGPTADPTAGAVAASR